MFTVTHVRYYFEAYYGTLKSTNVLEWFNLYLLLLVELRLLELLLLKELGLSEGGRLLDGGSPGPERVLDQEGALVARLGEVGGAGAGAAVELSGSAHLPEGKGVGQGSARSSF